jgi:hypothetical protein
MAITSVFYDTAAGTPASLVDEVKWAHAHPQIGSSKYGVEQVPDFKVTAHPTIANTVNVAIGKAWGHGVWVESDAVIPVTMTAPGAGATRWDMICIRRDWTGAAGGPTTVIAVEGGAVATMPAGRQNIPGTLDDQPIALVQWTAGFGAPTAIRDLRVWGGDGGCYANDDLVLEFLNHIGTQVTIGLAGAVWQYVIGAGDLPTWRKIAVIEHVQLFGFTNSLEFTPAAGQTGFLMQAGTLVQTTDSNGFASVMFSRPFPNGLLTAIVTNGDTSIDRGTTHAHVYGVAGTPWDAGRKHGFAYSVAFTNADGQNQMAPGRLHRINYIALGW